MRKYAILAAFFLSGLMLAAAFAMCLVIGTEEKE